MNNYEHFKLEDFVSNDEFIYWCLYPNEQSNHFWNNWIESHPDKESLIFEARQLVTDLNSIEKEKNMTNFEEDIWTQIEANTADEKVPNKQRRLHWILTTAACLLLLLNLTLWLQVDRSSNSNNTFSELEWVNVENSSGISKIISLSDNSSIVLEPFSSLKYPAHFSTDQRVVFLNGEAFFDIARDTNRPFLVYANETITKVLGTSFRITAFEGQETVEVDVRTGKVAVYGRVKSDTENNSYKKQIEIKADEKILVSKPNTKLEVTPNQKVVFNKTAEVMVKKVTAVPLMLTKIERLPQLEFENASVINVFEALEKAYGIDLDFNSNDLLDCTITTKLDNKSLFDKLNIICTALDLNFTEKEAKIFIKGKGC